MIRSNPCVNSRRARRTLAGLALACALPVLAAPTALRAQGIWTNYLNAQDVHAVTLDGDGTGKKRSFLIAINLEELETKID